jgi:serine/threonine protein kinase
MDFQWTQELEEVGMEMFTRYELKLDISFSTNVPALTTNALVLHKQFMFNTYVKQGVYNGEVIAMKLLHVDTVQGLDDQQFKNEVGNLLRVKHPNIVRLLGYCYEIRFKFVKYNAPSLAPNWSTRYNIIKGVCEGLNFLHGCEPPILHLDLKPANILLDSSMVSKVADFGLSRLFTQSRTHVTEKIVGTQ